MRVTEIFDDYLENRLSDEEKRQFEQRLTEDPVFANAFNEHRELIQTLNESAERDQFRSLLNDIHERTFPEKRSAGYSIWRTVSVAAATALVAVLSTILILSHEGYLITSRSNQFIDLKHRVGVLRATSEGIVEGITRKNKTAYAPANFEGSAFAFNNAGYIITSYHTIKGADSIFIRNSHMDRSAAKLVLTDPALDLAVLKLEDQSLASGWQVPFNFKEKAAEVSERVFTLGYPRNEMVYGEGSLSSLSGYSNDTTMYQVSIPVNPGNSGGPLLDDHGNVIGVIRGKESGAEGTGFAVKTADILRSIREQAPDSLSDLTNTIVKKQGLKQLKRTEQVKKINPYVFNVLVYKTE